MIQIVAQLTGFLAVIVAASVFQLNRRLTMLPMDMVAAILWATHFALLGAWTGTAMNSIGAVRNLAFQLKVRHWVIPAVFIAAFTAGTGFTWWLGDGPLSLLPLAGMIAGTVAYWIGRPFGVRLATVISAPLWLVYNAVHLSLAGTIIEVVLLISALIGIYRYDMRGRPEAAQVPAEA